MQTTWMVFIYLQILAAQSVIVLLLCTIRLMKMTKICVRCGTEFSRPLGSDGRLLSNWKWNRKQFCSNKCRIAANRITVYEVGRWRRM